MIGQDRKRAFSQAFNSASQPMRNPGYQTNQNLPRANVASRPHKLSMPSSLFDSDKENTPTVCQGKVETTGVLAAPHVGYQSQQNHRSLSLPYHMDVQPRGHPLQDISRQQYMYNGATGQSVSTTACLTPGDLEVRQFYVLTPFTTQVSSLVGSSPPSFTSNCGSSSLQDSGESGPIIYEDPDVTMCGQLVPVGPPTPSALNLQDLSLQDIPRQSVLPLPGRPVVRNDRASVYFVHSAIFNCTFPTILPNEVVIVFDKGRKMIKTNKYPLCNESRFFAQLLDGPFLESHTRCIRLRGNFPYGIKAMLEYVDSGMYSFDANMRVEYPHITLLDLHIHAYCAGDKYHIPRLCKYAVAQYISIGSMILSLRVPSASKSGPDNFQSTAHSHGDPVYTPIHAGGSHPNDLSAAAIMDRFLDSLVLLWRNTPNRSDPMRAAVLNLIKPSLDQLMRQRFFITMMLEMISFGDDIVQSLEEDGFEVTTFLVPAGMERRWGLRFGVI
ncbi:hypothetical protein BKA66DRAFT_571681 [Pyrenochaeta sp. MPI-SDFR-AT-0127]|nr:hypothetical protein BKA66DRAFT_571681 [Pyrenochaeta sp. MPI-SDFR-AT-0127]